MLDAPCLQVAHALIMGPSLSSLVLSCLLSHTIHASHAGSLNEDALHRLKRSGNAASGADDDVANTNDKGPSLSIPTWTVAATGTGTSYAQACDSESAVYDNIHLIVADHHQLYRLYDASLRWADPGCRISHASPCRQCLVE
jgi:hypothetical protein